MAISGVGNNPGSLLEQMQGALAQRSQPANDEESNLNPSPMEIRDTVELSASNPAEMQTASPPPEPTGIAERVTENTLAAAENQEGGTTITEAGSASDQPQLPGSLFDLGSLLDTVG